MNRLIHIALFLTISLTAKSQDYCDFIQTVQKCQDTVKLERVGDDDDIDLKTFDINTYLSLFDNIEVEKDYLINVLFFDNHSDGNPYLYALKEDQRFEFKDKRSLYNFLNKDEIRAKNHIAPKASELGFLQYLFFYEMGEQFALKWHANKDGKSIICSKAKLEKIVNELRRINLPPAAGVEDESPEFIVDLKELDKFKQIDPAVKVEMKNNFCMITWIEDRRGGIYKCKYKIQKQSPYKIERVTEKRLLEIISLSIF